jgi:hypothetical protein
VMTVSERLWPLLMWHFAPYTLTQQDIHADAKRQVSALGQKPTCAAQKGR